jgi:hypothetical protein
MLLFINLVGTEVDLIRNLRVCVGALLKNALLLFSVEPHKDLSQSQNWLNTEIATLVFTPLVVIIGQTLIRHSRYNYHDFLPRHPRIIQICVRTYLY